MGSFQSECDRAHGPQLIKAMFRSFSRQYWSSWFGLLLLRAISVLPYSAMMAIGRLAGRVAHRLLASRREVAAINLALCFPDKSKDQRLKLLKSSFESMGMGLMEVAIAWWWSERRVSNLNIRYNGLEYLENREKQGTIFLSAHFSSMELSARMIGKLTPCHVMYRPHENPVMEQHFVRHRSLYGNGIVSKFETTRTARILKSGDGLWIAPDQDFCGKGTLFARFFNVTASANPSVARFARLTGARVIPYAVFRDGAEYVVEFGRPWEDFPTDSPPNDARRMNELFEQWIRRYPEQYMWLHRKFKTRPEGDPSPY